MKYDMSASYMSDEVLEDLSRFIATYLDSFKAELKEFNIECLEITFGINETGDKWNYQTGDNSYTGPVYSFPIWAVCYIDEDTKAIELLADIIEQFGDQLAELPRYA